MRLFSQDSKAAALGRSPLFSTLSRRDLNALARLTEDLEVGPGKALCREGRTGQEFFVIVSGEVEVSRGGRALGRLGPGDFFGEIALVERTPRTATVTAVTPLRFFVLTAEAFRGLLQRQPEIERKVLRAAVRHLQSDEAARAASEP